MESSGLDSASLQVLKTTILSKSLVPQGKTLSRCASSPTMSSPIRIECYTSEHKRVGLSSATISRSQSVNCSYASSSLPELSTSTSNSLGGANRSTPSLPHLSTSLHIQPTETDDNVVFRQIGTHHLKSFPVRSIPKERNTSSSEYSVRALAINPHLPFNLVNNSLPKQRTPSIPTKQAEVGSVIAQLNYQISCHQTETARRKTTPPQLQGCDPDLNDVGSEILFPGITQLKSSMEAIPKSASSAARSQNQKTMSGNSQANSTAGWSRSSFSGSLLTPTASIIGRQVSLDLPREKLSITHTGENITNGYSTTQRLQSSQAWYGHYVPPHGDSARRSHSLRLDQNPYFLTTTSRLHCSHKPKNNVVSGFERQSSVPLGHSVTPFTHLLSRIPTLSNEQRLSPVLRKAPSDSPCARPLPRSGLPHQRHILVETSPQRRVLGEVQSNRTSSQDTPKLKSVLSVSEPDGYVNQPIKGLKSHSLSHRDYQSIRSISNGNVSVDSGKIQKPHSNEVDVEIISPFLRDIMQIMADHGESISKSPFRIEFPIEKQSLLTERSREQSSQLSFESEKSSIKPPSLITHGTHSSGPSSAEPYDEILPEPRPRSSPSGFSLRKFPGIESRLKKTPLFVRPSTSGSIQRIHTHVRKRGDLGKMTHYSDSNTIHGLDPLVTKTQKFEALLKASDASNGGTIKMSLSSKIDNMNEAEDRAPTISEPSQNLNAKLFSSPNNWIDSFSIDRAGKLELKSSHG